MFFGDSSCSVYPCNPIVLPHFIIKPPTTAWTWGRPEDEAPPPPIPLYTIRGRGILNPLVSDALLGGCSIQTTREGAIDVGDWAAEALFGCKIGFQLPLSFGRSGLTSLGGAFPMS